MKLTKKKVFEQFGTSRVAFSIWIIGAVSSRGRMAFSLASRLLSRHIMNVTLNGPIASLGTCAAIPKDGVRMLISLESQLQATPHTLACTGNNSKCKEIADVTTASASFSEVECLLNETFSNLSLSSTELQLTKEYVLPSVFPFSHSERAILDPLPHAQIRECPSYVKKEIIERPLRINEKRIDTPSPQQPIVEKQARRIMKIRRKKMKKHQYKKWKKRNKFKLRAMFAKRRKKKQKLWEEHLEKYKFKGLTPEYIDWYKNKKKDEAAIFLRHLGIHVEEETPESIEETERREKLRKKKTTVYLDPKGSMRVVPAPILPEKSNLKIALDREVELAREKNDD